MSLWGPLILIQRPYHRHGLLEFASSLPLGGGLDGMSAYHVTLYCLPCKNQCDNTQSKLQTLKFHYFHYSQVNWWTSHASAGRDTRQWRRRGRGKAQPNEKCDPTWGAKGWVQARQTPSYLIAHPHLLVQGHHWTVPINMATFESWIKRWEPLVATNAGAHCSLVVRNSQ